MLFEIIRFSVYCDSEVDCSDCASPNAWCQEMPEIRDDSVCQYVPVEDGMCYDPY